MTYRIEYADGTCCNFVNSRKDLIEWLKLLKNETVSDIRKIYNNGVSGSVMKTYKQFFKSKVRKRVRKMSEVPMTIAYILEIYENKEGVLIINDGKCYLAKEE